MVKVWESDKDDHPETAEIVQAGIDKLEEYSERISAIPAYVLAMSSQFNFNLTVSILTLNLIVLNPSIKLGWFNKYKPEKATWAKKLLLQEVFHLFYTHIIMDAQHVEAETILQLT